MNIQTEFPELHAEIFVRERLESAQRYRFGEPSLAVSMVGRVAKGLRRVASGVESWAEGARETPAAPQRPVSVR